MLNHPLVFAFFAQTAADDAGRVVTEVEESVRWLNMPPAWLAFLFIVPLVIAFVAFFYRRENPAGPSAWRWVLGGFRALVILLALLMLAQPVRHKKTFEKRDSTLLVLVDDSLSQDIKDRYSDRSIPERTAELLGTTTDRVEDVTRYDLVRRLFTDPRVGLIEKLRRKGKVAVATFAKSVHHIAKLDKLRDGEEAGAELDGSSGDGGAGAEDGGLLPPYASVREDPRVQETRIAEALRDGVSGVLGLGFGKRQERVSGVLLLSDLRANADTISPLEFARRLGERKCPVYVVGVGNPDEPKDVRLLAVDVHDVVLVDDVVPFDVSLAADGFEGERVRIDLRFDSQVVDTEYLVLQGGGKRQSVRLEYQPKTPGKFTATVDVEKLGGEIFYENNSISKTVTVLDQKIKVLYAEWLPRWEYRYLKNALIRDKTVEAQVFLFSADPKFPQESSPGIPSLESFPRERSRLFEYHVIILGDIDPEKHLGSETQALLKDFVAEGGGIVFLAGPHNNPSRYSRHSDLYTLMPVEVPDPGARGGRDGPITKSFNVRLTAVGKEHPLMRLDNDPDQNRRLWENEDGQFYGHLPGFYWFAETGPAKANAVVLAVHPERMQPLSSDPKPMVIFGFMSYGRGKTFFSAVDNTWRWRAGVDNLYFYRFWGQVCRFVASGRLLGKTPRYSITTDKEVYTLGESVRIECQVYDANMNPSTDPSITVYHQVQGRENEPPEKLELPLYFQGQGVYQGTAHAALRGQHDLWIGTEGERLAFATYRVEVPALEWRDTRLHREMGRKIAEASGGLYFDLPDVTEAVDKIEGMTRVDDGVLEHDDLWDEWWVVVLITGVLAGEWILRKAVRLT